MLHAGVPMTGQDRVTGKKTCLSAASQKIHRVYSLLKTNILQICNSAFVVIVTLSHSVNPPEMTSNLIFLLQFEYYQREQVREIGNFLYSIVFFYNQKLCAYTQREYNPVYINASINEMIIIIQIHVDALLPNYKQSITLTTK